MHGFIKQFGVAFEPEAVKTLTDAFDDAWQRLQASGTPYASPEYADAARAHLAKSIINSARRGVWNQQTLVEEALFFVACQKLSRVPPPTKL